MLRKCAPIGKMGRRVWVGRLALGTLIIELSAGGDSKGCSIGVGKSQSLLIAKLDRLGRDAHFLLGLQKAGVRFVAADMPEANEMVVGIMAVIAQADRKMISSRTGAALAEARKRVAVIGQRDIHPEIKRLGCPTGAAHLRGQGFDRLAVQALKAKADERAAGLASTLNARGYATARGGRWTARSVLNVMARLRAVRACARARNAL